MINLLPDDIKNARRYATRNLLLSKYCVFVAVILACIVTAYGYGYYMLRSSRVSITESVAARSAELSDLESLTKEAQGISDTISTASTLLSREIKFSELITNIGSVMPEGAKLTRLSLTGDKTKPLEIQATLSNPEQAATLQNNLLTLDQFEAADIQEVRSNITVDDETQAEVKTTVTRLLVTFNTKTKAKPATEATP